MIECVRGTTLKKKPIKCARQMCSKKLLCNLKLKKFRKKYLSM